MIEENDKLPTGSGPNRIHDHDLTNTTHNTSQSVSRCKNKKSEPLNIADEKITLEIAYETE